MLGERFLGLGGNPFDNRNYTSGSIVDHTGSGAVAGPLKIAAVWRAINVLAAGVAVLPVDIFRQLYGPSGKKAGKEILVRDPRRRLLRRRPNNIQTSYRWRHHMMGHLLLGGNYYLHKMGDPEMPEQLWPLDPARVQVTDLRSNGSLIYRYTTTKGEPKELQQSQVIHLRGFSLDGITGVSVVELMRQTTSLAESGRVQRASFMRNELRPSVVVKHPKAIGDVAADNIKKGLKRAYGGPNKAGEALILEEGADIAQFGFSSRDAQVVEGEHFLIEEFLRFIGVPGVLAGHADKTATYASAEQFFQSFITHGIYPWTRNIESELDFSLFGEDEEDVSAQFNLDALLRPDSAARATFYRTMVEMGILTRNEVRELENRDPLEGLDEPLTPANMNQGGPPAPPAAPPPRQMRPPMDDEPPEDDDEEADSRARAIARRRIASLVRKEVLAVAGGGGGGRNRGLAERYASDTAGFAREVRTFYDRHAVTLAEELELPAPAARAYCDEQLAALLSSGVAALASWETDRAAALERLALGG